MDIYLINERFGLEKSLDVAVKKIVRLQVFPSFVFLSFACFFNYAH